MAPKTARKPIANLDAMPVMDPKARGTYNTDPFFEEGYRFVALRAKSRPIPIECFPPRTHAEKAFLKGIVAAVQDRCAILARVRETFSVDAAYERVKAECANAPKSGSGRRFEEGP